MAPAPAEWPSATIRCPLIRGERTNEAIAGAHSHIAITLFQYRTSKGNDNETYKLLQAVPSARARSAPQRRRDSASQKPMLHVFYASAIWHLGDRKFVR